jgi:predicted permease
MGFLSLLLVASLPIVQILLIGVLGAYLATGHSNILTPNARKDINKIVYAVFTPALVFSNLAKTVTLQDIISWWFMPVNIGIIFLVGGIIGWIAVKILKPQKHLRGLIIASCSAGNFGTLLVIIIPAVCDEDGNPFGSDKSICRAKGLSYASFSMALGGFYIWTHTYSLMKRAAKLYHRMQLISNTTEIERINSVVEERDDEAIDADHEAVLSEPEKSMEEKVSSQLNLPLLSSGYSSGFLSGSKRSIWERLKDVSHQIFEELLAPPTLSAIIGFIVGAIPWFKNLIIGDGAPLRVIQDSIKLLGDGTIPCVTLILGGNLTQGLRKSGINPVGIMVIIIVRYIILPVIGIAVVKAAYQVGFLPQDPLYQYVLMVQFTLPPAMNIGTMAQLFDVGQEECSVIFLWTYLVAAIALTIWSTIFMWILS